MKIVKRIAKKLASTKNGHKESSFSTATVLSSTAGTQEGFDETFAWGRRLLLSRFNGQVLVHVREFVSMGEREFPTKKGVCFTPGRLSVLRGKIEEIDEALRQQETNASYGVEAGPTLYKVHLGAGIYASVSENYNGVSLRRYWVPEGQLSAVPTRNGIYLPASQWRALKVKLEELMNAHPELREAKECVNSHDSHMEMVECRECMPFGWTL